MDLRTRILTQLEEVYIWATIFKNHLLISLKFKTGIPYDLGISVLSVSLKDKHAYVHKRNAHSSHTDKAKI